MNHPKKKPSDVGTVLKKLSDPAALKPWADYIAGIDPWKSLDITAEKMLTRWAEGNPPWKFYSAADPKNAKIGGFDHEHGLIVFTVEGGQAYIERLLKGPMPQGMGEGGYIATVATKLRHKGIGKYLMHAAERVVCEKYTRMYLFVSEGNTAALRFYKSAGYEEIARALDCLKPGNTEILMTKSLA